jgi:thioredoxin
MEAAVHHVKSVNDYANLLNSSDDKLVVVKFSAKWCGPCRKIAPYFEELASTQFTGVVFIHVDVDELAALPEAKDVMSLPTFRFYRDGLILDQFSGASREKLLETLMKLN